MAPPEISPGLPILPHPSDVSDPRVQALLAYQRVGAPPADLLPGRPAPELGPPVLFPGAEFHRQAGTTLGQVGVTSQEGVAKWSGVGRPVTEDARRFAGVDHLANSYFAPEFPNPQTRAEGEALFRQAQAQEILATQGYETGQRARMTGSTREAYDRARAEVVAAYQEEKPAMEAYLARVQAVGAPDPSALNDAKLDLDVAVENNPYLRERGIGPREFQILHKRHEYETYAGGDPGVRQFLRSRAYGQERQYVVETILNSVTHMIQEGTPKREWRRLEARAAQAIGIYDRLIQGERLNSRDMRELARIRGMAFPYEMDMTAPELDDVRTAQGRYVEARDAFAGASHAFVEQTASEAQAMNHAAEEASMRRERADFEFQQVRLREEWGRLERYVEASAQTDREVGGRKFQELRQIYEARVAEYEGHHRDYVRFWERMHSGEDVTAREYNRNAKDKQVLFDLAFKAQWALFEL